MAGDDQRRRECDGRPRPRREQPVAEVARRPPPDRQRDDGRRGEQPERDERHHRPHGRRQHEQHGDGEDDLHDLPGRALPHHGAQPVADAAVDVAQHAAGQREVEEDRAVVRGHRRAQRQLDAEAARPRPSSARRSTRWSGRRARTRPPAPRRRRRAGRRGTGPCRAATPGRRASRRQRRGGRRCSWQRQQVGVVDGDGELPGRRLREPPLAVGASASSAGSCSHAAGSSRRATRSSARRGRASRRQGLGRTRTSPPSCSAAAATASGPSRPSRRWWALNAAARRASSGSAGVSVTPPVTVIAISVGSPAQAPSIPASSSAVSMSSSAEAVTRLAPASSPGASRVMSDRRVSKLVAASSSRPSSRSCTTQCCGPGSRGASQRPIAPLPPPRSWMASGPSGRWRARRSASSSERAAASAGSRSSSHCGDDHAHRATTAAASVSTPATSAVVSSHPRSDARRSRAARRRRSRSSALAEPAPQRGAEGRRVARAGPAARAAVPERLAHAADVGGEHRQAAGQRLGDDHAVGLRARGEHEQVGFGVCAVELRSGPRPRERARARAPCRRTSPANAGSRSRLPTHVQRQGRSPTVASPSSSTSCPLPGVTAATHSSASPAGVPAARPAASTPGSATCAGTPYSSSSRRRLHSLVTTTAAAAASTSRSRAFPSGMCRSTTCLQPVRLRHERLWCRRGDQPVDQHHGAVRDPRERACEGGGLVRRRARAPSSRARRARRRPGGRTCCRRSAARGRRCPPGR